MNLRHVFFEHILVADAASWIQPQRKYESEGAQIRFAQAPEASFVAMPFVAVQETPSHHAQRNFNCARQSNMHQVEDNAPA
jgi:hypothetical protein